MAVARARLRGIREELSGANHHAYAFRVGYGATVTEGKSDDGEPKGTAGAPLLTILRGSELGDVLLVVSRHFGGRKLGKGGLVRAYGDAARLVLAKLPVVERVEGIELLIELPYSHLARLRRLMRSEGVQELSCDYGTVVRLQLTLAMTGVAAFCDAVREIGAGKISIEALTSASNEVASRGQ